MVWPVNMLTLDCGCMAAREQNDVYRDFAYDGDMNEELTKALLEDMDFFNNKVKCAKIERMLQGNDGIGYIYTYGYIS